MQHIIKMCVKLYTISDSKFYAVLIPCYSIDDVKSNIDELKREFPDATHYCYAYIIDGHEKAYDDGEPGGTAGIPILNVLKNNNLNYVLACVIRYFGGTKLGASNLLRAYMQSVKNAIDVSEIKNYKNGYLVSINFYYDNIKNIDYLLKDYEIVDKTFNDNVEYIFKCDDDLSNYLGKYIISYKVIDNIII